MYLLLILGIWVAMNSIVDRPTDTWHAAFRLAAATSVLAAAVAMLVSVFGDVPQAAVVLPVIVVAFVASWIQSGRAPADVSSHPVRTGSDRSARTLVGHR